MARLHSETGRVTNATAGIDLDTFSPVSAPDGVTSDSGLSGAAGNSLFSGEFGQKYPILTQATPAYTVMQQIVGKTVADYVSKQDYLQGGGAVKVADIGCGDGATSHAVLEACSASRVVGIDKEPTMIKNAEVRLGDWMLQQKVTFAIAEALDWFRLAKDGALDIVVSAFTLHNFTQEYRQDLLAQIFRVLRPGGIFVNADIYVSDDDEVRVNHLRAQVERIFAVLSAAREYELLCYWAAHYIDDQRAETVMKKNASVQVLRQLGFSPTQFVWDADMHAVITAQKPNLG